MNTPLPRSLMLVALVASPALRAASPNPAADDAVRYEQADTNRDGRISREEFITGVQNKKNWWALGENEPRSGQNAATPEMFTALDRDRDGFLSREELAAGRKLRESRGDNGAGASGTRSERPPDRPADRPKAPSKSDRSTRDDAVGPVRMADALS